MLPKTRLTRKSIEFRKHNNDKMIVLPGGRLGTENLSMNGIVSEQCRLFAKDKYVAAVCAAPSILARLGLMKKATVEEWSTKRSEKITIIDDGTSTNETRLGAVKDIQVAVASVKESTDYFVMAGDNMLDFSLRGFIEYASENNASCIMCHEEHRLEALQKTAVITIEESGLITSYEEKPKVPKGLLAVPPFYIYRAEDICRIQEALDDGCGFDAPGSFAAWLSTRVAMYAYLMPGHRYDIGDIASYEAVKERFNS